ncbi:hypothetical protein BDQ12DRAFT_675262 [Crucibulum laeve]|uniref:Uncharacterized protein n=1 Tax=Crucibulum laeve TaxID=68775 RepID=A0A5C3MFB3_9AGAR|nr:hypothetical protein BDQ12DRAFT_675262 [Crucibulum laeve]
MISDHLRTIPKLDKQSFISTYVQTQKAFAKEHSVEGHSFATLWTNDNKPKPTTILPHDVKAAGCEEYRDYGFNTPVLKPRKMQKSNTVLTESKELKKAIRETKQTQNTVDVTITDAKSNKSRTRQSHLPPKSTQKLKPSQKRAIAPELDANGHIDRLAERRERKRIKRDIIKPKEISYVADKIDPDDENKKRKGKKGKLNVALGFALMHGFSASNVGKKRLTMQPPLQTAGVFGKGKASAKTATVKKSLKKGRYNDGFSEMKFLNSFPTKGGKRSFQDSTESISDASSHSNSSSVHYPPLSPKQQVSPTHKRCTKTRSDKENKSISSRSPRETKRKRVNPDSELHTTIASSDRIGSIVWDIEKEGFELPPTALSERRQETVILSARNLPWMHKDLRVSNAHEKLTRTLLSAGGQKSFDEMSSISSSSISPSQSASQCPNPVLPRPLMIACDSKYFQPSVPDTANVDIEPQIRHVSDPEIVDEGDNKDHSRFPGTSKEGELLAVASTVSDPKNCFLPSNSETRPDIQKTAILGGSVVAPPNSMGESHACSHDIDSAGQGAHIHHFSNVHIPIIPPKSRPDSVLQEQLFSAVHRDLPHNASHIPKTVSSGQAEWLEFDQFRSAWDSDPQLDVDCFDEYRTYGNDIDGSSNLGFEDYTYTAEEIYIPDVVQLDEDLRRYRDFGPYDLGITPTNDHPDHRVVLDHLDEYGNFDPVDFSGLFNSQNHESCDMNEMEETYGHRQLPFSAELPYIFYQPPSPSSTFRNINYVECDDLESTYEDNTDIMSVSSYDSFADSVGPDEDSEIHHLSALRFLQGKELLHGYAEMQQNQRQTHQQTRISTTEADVAKTLKHHWLPQKF